MIILATLRQTSACTVSTATVKVINTLSYSFRKTITYTFSFLLKIPMTHESRTRHNVESPFCRFPNCSLVCACRKYNEKISSQRKNVRESSLWIFQSWGILSRYEFLKRCVFSFARCRSCRRRIGWICGDERQLKNASSLMVSGGC